MQVHDEPSLTTAHHIRTFEPTIPSTTLHMQVHDPMNLGSIMRSALFFGANGVILAKGSAPLSVSIKANFCVLYV